MEFLKDLFKDLFKEKNIDPKNQRMYTALNYVFMVGLSSHVMIMIFFFIIGLQFMAYFNIISICAFLTAYFLNRKGYYYPSFYIGGLEVFIHAVLSVYFLGWDSGFHYYALIVAVSVFLANIPLFLKWTIASLGFGIYAGLFYYSVINDPAFIIRDQILDIINILNIFITFVSLSMLAMYYRRAADISERELKRQSHKLKQKNMIMEKELDLARNIQMGLIPSSSPMPQISYFYQPMMKVGGDFFDFVQFEFENKTGIFLSDVSGHGVPAALLTSMLKSMILQSKDVLIDPAQFFKEINTSLFHQSGGNFVTAFYGIIDWSSREFVFANAGHNPPIILHKDKMSYLNSDKSSAPLLAFSNEELVKYSRIYDNDSLILEAGTKLILYTDGMTEAINKADKKKRLRQYIPDFEACRLESSLLEFSTVDGAQLIEGVVKDLIQFRGSESFDDDVCIICLDIH